MTRQKKLVVTAAVIAVALVALVIISYFSWVAFTT
jgi:hypothetical protein